MELSDLVNRLGTECRDFVLSYYQSLLEELARAANRNLSDLAKRLSALANEVRLAIISLLSASRAPLPLCLISALMRKNPQLVSYHLRVLKDCGLVKEVEMEKFRLYSIDRNALLEVIEALRRVLENNP